MKAYFRKDNPQHVWSIDFLNQSPAGPVEHHPGSMSLVHVARVIEMVKNLMPKQQVMVANTNGELRGRIVAVGDHMAFNDQLQMFYGERFEARQLVDGFEDIHKPDLTGGATKQEFNVQPHMRAIAQALQCDPDYAWSWYCNLKMMVVDVGGQYRVAAKSAARQLQLIFEFDITKHAYFAKDFADSFAKDLSHKVTNICRQEFSEPEILTFEALIELTAYNDKHMTKFPNHDKVILDRLVSLGFAKHRPKDGKYIDEGYTVTDSGLKCFFAARLSHHSYLKVPATELTVPGMAAINRAQEAAKAQANTQRVMMGAATDVLCLDKHLVMALGYLLEASGHKLSLEDLNKRLVNYAASQIVERDAFPLLTNELITVSLVGEHNFVAYTLTPKGVNVALWLSKNTPTQDYTYVEVPSTAFWRADTVVTTESQFGEGVLAFAEEFLAATEDEAAEVDNRPDETRRPSMAQIVLLRAMIRSTVHPYSVYNVPSWPLICEWIAEELVRDSTSPEHFMVSSEELDELQSWGLITLKGYGFTTIDLTPTGVKASEQLNRGPLVLRSREYSIPVRAGAAWFEVPKNMKSRMPHRDDTYSVRLLALLDIFPKQTEHGLVRQKILMKLQDTGWSEEVIKDAVRSLVMAGYLWASWTTEIDAYGYTKAGLDVYLNYLDKHPLSQILTFTQRAVLDKLPKTTEAGLSLGQLEDRLNQELHAALPDTLKVLCGGRFVKETSYGSVQQYALTERGLRWASAHEDTKSVGRPGKTYGGPSTLSKTNDE